MGIGLSVLPTPVLPSLPSTSATRAPTPTPPPQLSAIKGMIGEVRLGLRVVHNEVVAAAKTRDAEGSGSRHFSEMMAAFHATSCEDFCHLEVGGAGGGGAVC